MVQKCISSQKVCCCLFVVQNNTNVMYIELDFGKFTLKLDSKTPFKYTFYTL